MTESSIGDHREIFYLRLDIISEKEIKPENLALLVEDMLHDGIKPRIYSVAVFPMEIERQEPPAVG